MQYHHHHSSSSGRAMDFFSSERVLSFLNLSSLSFHCEHLLGCAPSLVPSILHLHVPVDVFAFDQSLSGLSSPFSELFNTSMSLPNVKRPILDGIQFRRISGGRLVWLEREFSNEEIKVALDGLVGDKAPGPDGFNLTFFQSCWEIVGPNFLRVCREFHQT